MAYAQNIALISKDKKAMKALSNWLARLRTGKDTLETIDTRTNKKKTD